MSSIKRIINSFTKRNTGNLNIIGKLASIIVIVIVIWVINKLVSKLIDRTLTNRRAATTLISDKRANTLGEVLKKLVYYVLIFISTMIVLDIFNIPTRSILATAGIGGLAIGFGAQSLVKDIITGFFILLENQYSVGDLIESGDFEGVVEELGLRVTKLRAFSGELHIIPNSNIQIVTNKTRGAMRALVQVTVSYKEDINKTIEVLDRACKEIGLNNELIVEGPTVLGVTDLNQYGVTINIVAKTQPMDQWSIERQIRKRVKETLEEEGIQISQIQKIIIGGENNDSTL